MSTQFYFVLAETLHLQFGNILVGTKPQLQDWPFLPSVDSPDEIQRISQNLGSFALLIFQE